MKVFKNFFYNVGYQILIIIVPLILAPYISLSLIHILTVDTDVREWRPGEMIAFTVRADLQDGKEYEVWLKVTGEKDQEPVLFASENPVAEDVSYCLGRIRKGD